MDRKKQLKQDYKEIKPVGGIFQIKNTSNGKVFLITTPNIKTMNGQKFQLESHSHKNKDLQSDWDRFGKESFVFEVLETIEPDDAVDTKLALKKLHENWLDKIQPFGDKGYN